NQNVFTRLDLYMPWNTRLVLRYNFAGADNTVFSRSSNTSTTPNFNLTSNRYELSSRTHSGVAEFLTNMPSGVFNELLFNLTATHDFRTVPVKFPQITVQNIPRVGGAS